MRIIFLCGSLEPGKDGVGDYTRRLAGELIRQGHSCGIVAIMDKGVSVALEETQQIEATIVSVLRLPYSNGYEKSGIDAKPWVDAFNPEWISLQYVPFSFHPKGLPFSLGKTIQQHTKERNVHIMFHELWCGMDVNSSFKEKILGYGQRIILKKLVRELSPNLIFTNINYYYKCLTQQGILGVQLVPNFGNISVTEYCSELEWNNFISKTPLLNSINCNNLKKELVLCFFGSIYPNANLLGLLEAANAAAKMLSLKLVIITVGNNRGENIQKQVSKLSNADIINLGPLDAGLLNKIFYLVDFGILTSPASRLNKSGSAIVWIERGVPVLVPSVDNEITEEELLKEEAYVVNGVKTILDLYNGPKKVAKERLKLVAASCVNLFAER
jgi:hypothetical protein